MKFNIVSIQTPIFRILIFIILLVFVSIGIVIQHLSLNKLDNRIMNVQRKVAEQKDLQAIYQVLKDKGQKKITVLPFHAKGSISRDQVESIPGRFRDIARQVNMDILYSSPDMNSIGPNSKYLIVGIGIRGDFFSFRNFLIALGNLYYVDRIEEIEIHESSDVMEFRLKIRIMMA